MPRGAIGRLPEPHRRRIAETVPQLPIDEIDRIGSEYRIMRDHRAEPPAEIRDALANMAQQAKELHTSLACLSEEAQNLLFEAGYGLGRPDLFNQGAAITRALSTAGLGAAGQIGPQAKGGKGLNKEWRHALVCRLAGLMQECGLETTASRKGDLCFIARSILDAYGDEVKNIDKLVAAALKRNAGGEAI